MASSEGDSLKQTKDETSQTCNSLLEQQIDQEEHAGTVPNKPDLSYSSPSTSSQYSCIEAVSPDETHVKEIATVDLGGGVRSSNPIQVDGQNLRHQNYHDQNEIPAETTLHGPNQEEHGRKGIQEDDPVGACSDTLDRPPSGEKINYIRSSSSNASSMTLCETCSAAAVNLLCSHSEDFWKTIEGSKCCEKIWLNVHKKLKESFTEERALDQARVVNLLKALCDVKHSTDVVKFHKFVELVRLFGLFRPETNGPGCVILRQLEYLVKNSTSKDGNSKKRKKCWFAGFMSREDAIAKLDGKPPGTFLVRISETESGSFSLDIVMLDGQIEHFLLKGQPEKAANSVPFRLHLSVNVGDCKRTFSSLPELVKHYQTEDRLFCRDERANGTMCTTVCPDLPFNHIINGYSE